MEQLALTGLAKWESFYVIVGSSAGALTGLQFVVMTLIGEHGPVRGREETISAFGTPNVVHFCASLLVASILSAPWSALLYAGVAVAGCGVLGLVYSVIVLKRALRQSAYRPVLEDWVWHTILPMLAYATLFVTGAMLGWTSTNTMFVLGAAVLLLVFIGIHNAWDTVTYVTVERENRKPEAPAGAAGVSDAGSTSRPGAGGSADSARDK